MTSGVYWTTWIALSLFAVGEFGKSGARRNPRDAGWFWRVSALGLGLMVIHIVVALSVRHSWSHESAVAATASQTNAVYGLNWGGGVYVNYLFVAIWMAELVAWKYAPARYAARSRGISWTLRAFYFIVIANAAIAFAAGWRRVLGVALVALLFAGWHQSDLARKGNRV